MVDFRCASHREVNLVHAVTADYAQGMLAGMRGGSPVRADVERRGSADWQGREGRTLLLLAWMVGFVTRMRVGTSTEMDCGCRIGRRAVLQPGRIG